MILVLFACRPEQLSAQTCQAIYGTINGEVGTNGAFSPTPRVGNAVPFLVQMTIVQPTDFSVPCLNGGNQTLQFHLQGTNAGFMSLIGTSSASYNGAATFTATTTLTISNTSSASLLVTLRSVQITGANNPVLTTTADIIVGPPASRLAFSTTAVDVVNPYNTSGWSTTDIESGTPVDVNFQTINDEFFPAALLQNTSLDFQISTAGGVSFSSTGSVSTASASMAAFDSDAFSTASLTFFYRGETPTDLTVTLLSVTGASLQSTSVLVRVSPLPADRLAFSTNSSTSAGGFSDFFTGSSTQLSVQGCTSGGFRLYIARVSNATFNPLDDRTATTATSLADFSLNAGGPVVIPNGFFGIGATQATFTTTSSLAQSNLSQPGVNAITIGWNGERATAATLSLAHPGLASTSVTVNLLVSDQNLRLGFSTTSILANDGFGNGTTKAQLSGVTNAFALAVGVFDACDVPTATMGNAPAGTFATHITLSLVAPGGPTLVGGPLTVTFANTAASTTRSISISWTGSVETTATLVLGDPSGTMLSTSLLISVCPPPPTVLAFSTTSTTGTDGLSATTFQMTATTINLTVTAASFNALDNLRAVTTATTAVFTYNGATAGTLDLTPSSAISSTTLSISYTGDVPLTASFDLSMPDLSLISTTLNLTLIPPPPVTLSWGTNVSTATDGFNGDNLVVNNQQIFNADFTTFNEFGFPSATSAGAWLAAPEFRLVTIRIVDSPFPSNPAIKPTFVGVGGVWAGGPVVTSTHATVFLSSTASLRSGVLQFAWLGEAVTTMTLSLQSGFGLGPGGTIATPGTLSGTTITVTIFPSPATRVAFSQTNNMGIEGWNPGDVTGTGSPTVLAIAPNATRSTVPIPYNVATYNITGVRAAVPVNTSGTVHIDSFTFPDRITTNVMSAGNPEYVTTTATGLFNSQSSTQGFLQIRWHGQLATTVTVRTTFPNATAAGLVDVTLLTPPAARIGMSTGNGVTTGVMTNTVGIDGLNGGDTNFEMLGLQTTSISISLSSYDLFNYLTATYNNTTAATPNATSFTVSLTAATPDLSIISGSTAILSTLAATTSFTLNVKWAGFITTTALLSITHDGDGSLGTTSATVTFELAKATRLAHSSTSVVGTDGFNGDMLSVVLNPTSASISSTVASFNDFGNLAATSSNTTAFAVQTLFGFPQAIIGSYSLSTQNAVSTATIMPVWDGALPTSAIISVSVPSFYLQTTSVNVSLLPPAAVTTAFSSVQNASSGTTGFNGGNLFATADEAVTVTVGTYNAFNWLRRATSATGTTAHIRVFNSDGNVAPNIFAGPLMIGGVLSNATSITLPGEMNTNLAYNESHTTSSVTFDWRGPVPTTAIVDVTELNLSPLGGTQLNVTIRPRPARYLAWSTTSTTDGSGFNGGEFCVQMTGVQTVATVPTTIGTFNILGDPTATTATTDVFGVQTHFGFAQKFINVYTLATTSPFSTGSVNINWDSPFDTSCLLSISTIGFTMQTSTITVQVKPPLANKLAYFGMTSTSTTCVVGESNFNFSLHSQNDIGNRATNANTAIVFTSDTPTVTIATVAGMTLLDGSFSSNVTLDFFFTAAASTTLTLTATAPMGSGLASTSTTITLKSPPTKLEVTSATDPVYCEQGMHIHWRTLNDVNLEVPVTGPTEIVVEVVTNPNSCAIGTLESTTLTLMPALTSDGTTSLTIQCCCTTATMVTLNVKYVSGPNVLMSTSTTVTLIPTPTKLAHQLSTTTVANNEPFQVTLSTLNPKDLKIPVTQNTMVGFVLDPSLQSGIVIDYISPGGPSSPFADLFIVSSATIFSGLPAVLIPMGSAMEMTTISIRLTSVNASLTAPTSVTVSAVAFTGSVLASTTFTMTVLPFEGWPSSGAASKLTWLENSPAITPITTAGVEIFPVPKVAVRDQFNNLITNYIGPLDAQIGTNASLCLDAVLQSNSGSASFPSTGVVRENINPGDFGIASFPQLFIEKTGVGYGLLATDPFALMQNATSNAFRVDPATPTQLAFFNQPPHVTTAGVTFAGMQALCPTGSSLAVTSTGLVVEMQDAFGNRNPNFITEIALSINGFTPRVAGAPQGSLTVTPLSQFTDEGRATFANLSIDRSGLYTLKATSSGLLTDAVSLQFEIEPATLASLVFSVQPTTTAAGNVITPNVAVEGLDAFSNRTTNASNTVDLSTTASLSLFGASSSFSQGIATYPLLRPLGPAGFYQLTATTASVAATSAIFEVLGGGNTLAYSTTNAAGTGGFNVGDASPTNVISGQVLTVTPGVFNAGGILTAVTAATVVQFTVTPTNVADNISLTGSTEATFVTFASTLSTTISLSYSGSVETTAVVTLTQQSGPALSSTSITVTVGPPTPADRLAFSTSATAVLNPYNTSGVETTAVLSRRSIDVNFQVLNDQLLPTATTSVTTVAFDVLGSMSTSVPGLSVIAPAPISLNTSETAYATSVTIQWVSKVSTTAILRLRATVGGSLLQTEATLTVTPFSTATRLAFTTEPSTVATAGSAFAIQPVVSVIDDYGNIVQNFTGAVNVSIDSDGSLCTDAEVLGTTNNTIFPADMGSAVYSDLYIEKSGTFTLRADWQDNTLLPATSASFVVNPATPTQLAFYSQPPHVTTAGMVLDQNTFPTPCPSGVTTALVLQLQDQFGNHNPNFDGTVTLSIGSYTPNVAGAYVSTGTLSVPMLTSGGQVGFTGVVLNRAGKYELSATAGLPYSDATSQLFEVVPEVPDDMNFSVQPTDVACNETFVPVVEVEVFDIFDNFVTQPTVSVNLDIVPEGTLFGTTTETVGATTGVSVFDDITSVHGLVSSNAHWLVATTAGVGVVTVTSALFDVLQGSVASLTYISPLPTTVECTGTTNINIDVRDICTNPVVGTTVTLTASAGFTFDGGLSVSTATSDGSGIASFTLTDVHGLVGSYTLTVESNNVTSTATIDILQGPVATANFEPLPTEVACEGTTILTIQLRDDCTNPVVGTTGTLTAAAGFTFDGGVMSSSATSDGSGVLTFVLTDVHGLAGSYALTVTSGAGTTTASIEIVQGPIADITISPLPTTVACSGTTTVTATVLDDCGNPVDGDPVWLTASPGFTFNGGASMLVTTSSLGIATFVLTDVDGLITGNPYTLTVTGGVVGVSAALISITQGPADAIVFSPLPTTVECSGTTTLTVAVEDECTNPVLGEPVTLTAPAGFTFDGGLAVSSATTGVGGLASFTLTNVDALVGSYTLTVTTSTLVSTSAAITVLQGPAWTAAFTPLPSEVRCDGATTLVVHIEDICTNPVVGTTVTLTAPLGFTFDGGLSMSSATTDGAGDATFTLTNVDATVGTYTLTATSGVAVTTASIDVLQGVPASMAFTPLPTDVACGSATTLTVNVLDICTNNVVGTGVTLTVSGFVFDGGLTSSSGTTDGAGNVSFTLTNVDGLVGSYPVTAATGGVTTTALLTILQGPVTTAWFSPLPTEVACGSSTTLVVMVEDQCTNPVVGTTVTLTAAAGFTFDGGLSVSTATSDGSGAATFTLTNVDALVSGSPYALTATVDAGTTTADIAVVQGPVATAAYMPLPTTVICSGTTTLTVLVEDQCGNPVVGTTGTLTASAGFTFDGGLSMSTATSDASGILTFTLTNVDALVAGSPYTLTVISGAGVTAADIEVLQGPVDVITFTPLPTSVACDESTTITVSLVDQCGNPLTGNLVTLTAPATFSFGGHKVSTATAVAGTASFTLNPVHATIGTYTLTVTSGTIVTTADIEVTVGAPAQITFEPYTFNTLLGGVQPVGGIAGNLIKGGTFATVPVVQVLDACGNLVSEPNIPIQLTFSTNAGSGTLFTNPGAGLSFTGPDGTATWVAMAVDKAGVGYGLKATATLPGGLQVFATSSTFDITHWVADKLAFNVQPPAVSTAATDFVTNPVIEVQDCFGNHVTTATNLITMSIATDPTGGLATLTSNQLVAGVNRVNAVGGLATFTGVQIDKAGDGYTLGASGSGLVPGFSNGFDIVAGDPYQLAIVAEPALTTDACEDISVTVQVQDRGGNHVTTGSVGINIGLQDNAGFFETATLSGTTTLVTVGGEASFTGLSIDKVGIYELVATETMGTLFPALTQQFTILVNSAFRVGFNIEPMSAKNDGPFNNVIQIHTEDCGGNQLLTDNDTEVTLQIHPSFNPTSTSLRGGATTATTVAGNASFLNPWIIRPGTYRLLATGANVFGDALVPATSASFTIYPGTANATRSTLSAVSTSRVEVCGSTIDFTVVKIDQWGFQTTCGTVDIGLIDNGSGGAVVSTTSIPEGVSTSTVTYSSGTTARTTAAWLAATISGTDIVGSPWAVEQFAGVATETRSIVSALDGTSVEVCGSTLNIKVIKRDKNYNVTTRGTVTVVMSNLDAGSGARITSTSAGVSGLTPSLMIDEGTSMATITYWSGTKAAVSAASIAFVVGGLDIVGTPLVIDQFAGTADATRSTITGTSTTVEVGGNTLSFDVWKRDKNGNVTTRGTVDLALVDNGSGGASIDLASVPAGVAMATVTYTSGTTASVTSAWLTAEIGGVDIVGSAVAIEQTAATASALTSSLSSTTNRVEVGANPLDMEVVKRDIYGNVTPFGVVDLSFTDFGAGAGAGVAPADVPAGVHTRTVTYTSGTTAGIAVAGVNATIGGLPIVGNVFLIDQFAGTAASITSTITGATTSVEVCGFSIDFDIEKYDLFGNATTRGFVDAILVDGGSGGAVITSATPGVSVFVAGSFLSVGEGLQAATISYQSGTTAGTAVADLVAEIGLFNDIVGSPLSIDQFAGPGVATTSTITGMDRVEVGGNALPLTVTKRDKSGNVTTRGTISLSLTDLGAGAGAGIDIVSVPDGQSSTTVTYTSGTTAGVTVATVSATLGGLDIVGSPFEIEQFAGTASSLTSLITPAAQNVLVGGKTIDYDIVKYDIFGNATTRGTVTVTGLDLGAGAGTAVSTTAIGEGLFGGTVTYTSGTTAGTSVFELAARIAGSDILNSAAQVNQLPEAPDHIKVVDVPGEVFTPAPATIEEATRNIEFTSILEVRDEYGNATAATLAVTLGGTAGATGVVTSAVLSSTHAIAATPTVPGTSLTVSFTDAVLGSTTLIIERVYDILSLSYDTPQTLTRFQPAVTIAANRLGGRPPFQYGFIAGSDALPSGLTLDATTGTISGIPDVATTLPLVVDLRVTDANGTVDDAQIIFTVAPVLTLFYTTSNTIFENQFASIPVSVLTGGVAPYSFATTAGGLPPGMTIDAGTGLISGVPTTTGSYTVTVTVTDVNDAEDNASLTITVVTQANIPTAVNVKVALQGAQNGSTTATIMDTDLNVNGFIPDTDPYQGTVTVASVPVTVVDWVEIELRTGTGATTAVASTVAFVRADGQVTGSDGISALLFPAGTLPAGDYYIVVKHRNHLWIMSADAVTLEPSSSDLYDFTTAQSQAFEDFQPAMVFDGVFGMYTGDADVSANQLGIINAADRVTVRNASGNTGYLPEDITLDGIVTAPDRVIVRNNSFKATQVP